MEKPNLKDNQYAVLHAEYATGHVLNIDKTKHIVPQGGEVFLIFESKNEAFEYVKKITKENPTIECSIWNAKNQHLATFDLNGERT